MSRELHFSSSPGEVRGGLLENGEMTACALWRPGKPDGWGDKHLVRVTAYAPALGGAFVRLAGALRENGVRPPEKEGFLPTKEKLREGALVGAEIVRSAQNGKSLRLRLLSDDALEKARDSDDSLKNEGANPRLLSRGLSPLEELAARAPEAPVFTDCAATAAALPASLHARLQASGPAALRSADLETLEAAWDALAQPSVSIGPLLAHIVPTPALTSIDLDSADQPDFAANLAAFPALAREIALRNLSGAILIDPAGVRSRKRAALAPFLQKDLEKARDPLQPRVLGATPGGLLELTRPRRRPPLHELLSSPHGRGLALLRRILHEALPGTTLHAPPAVVAALEADPAALAAFAQRRGAGISLVAAAPSQDFWKLL